METQKKDKKQVGAGTAVKIVILSAILICLCNLTRMPFLSESQRAAVQEFVQTHFDQVSMPAVSLDLGTVLSLVIMIVGVYVAEQILVMAISSIEGKVGRKATIKKLMLSVVRYAAVLIGLIWGLAIFGVNVGAIFAGVGIVGLVVGFGAQSLVEDIITGLFIIFEGQYSVGDIVCIDGFRGTVSSIGVRTTHIVDLGGNIKIINNSDVRNIQNLSSRNSMAVSDISISYSESIEKAEKVLVETLNMIHAENPDTFPNQPVYLGVQELGDSAVILRVTATVDEPNIYKARRIMNREMKLAFDRAGIEIPFPQLVVHKE